MQEPGQQEKDEFHKTTRTVVDGFWPFPFTAPRKPKAVSTVRPPASIVTERRSGCNSEEEENVHGLNC